MAAASGAALNVLVAHRLPNPWRNVFLGAVTAIEAAIVANNVTHSLHQRRIVFSLPL